MSIQTFKRLEDKFLITEEQYTALSQRIKDFMELDPFCEKGSYKILNIYFDSADGEVIRKSVQKPYFKEKLRLRSYGVPKSGESTVFLELKRKSAGIVNKRRATMTYDEAVKYMESGEKPKNADYLTSQVLREIDYFLEKTKAVPKYFLSYDRIAMFGKKDKGLRLTFDTNIQSRRDDLSFSAGCYGRQLLPPDTRLMEVKFLGAIPLELVKILSELKIYRRSFSKIGTEYKTNLLLEKEKSLQRAVFK
ncbi:MAG: polyphosphate polymerase domain-containing protein [Ruminiclostridium sp.]|nr:polyphosphate polymerase domain-containing protein [Ruminiclostridium sp.]